MITMASETIMHDLVATDTKKLSVNTWNVVQA